MRPGACPLPTLLVHQSSALIAPNAECLQQNNGLLIKHPAAGLAAAQSPSGRGAAPTGGGHVMARQSPSRPSKARSSAYGPLRKPCLGGDAGLKHRLQRRRSSSGMRTLSGTANSVAPLLRSPAHRPGSHQHLLSELLRFRDQNMARLMRNPTQRSCPPAASARMCPHAFPGSGINAEGDPGHPHRHNDPGSRQTQGRTKSAEGSNTGNGNAGPKCPVEPCRPRPSAAS